MGELAELARIAEGVLREAVPLFRRSLGAEIEIAKAPDDYATTADLALERQIAGALVERTGIEVHGEELGGADLQAASENRRFVWVLDPIDGTANFLQRIPLTGINLALLHGSEPVIGMTWLPFLEDRYLAIDTTTTTGEGVTLHRNGVPIPQLRPSSLADVTVGLGNLKNARGSAFPPEYRMAVLSALVERSFRVRMVGSSALDLAWVAHGRFGACVNFGGQIWDNAPGLCLVRAAGGEVLNFSGEPYRFSDNSIVAGAPGVIAELSEVFAELNRVHN